MEKSGKDMDPFMPKGESGPSKYAKESFEDSFAEEINSEDLSVLIAAAETFDERLKNAKEAGNTTVEALADTMTTLFIEIRFIKERRKTNDTQDTIIEKYATVFHDFEIERKRLLLKNDNGKNENLANEIRNNLKNFVSEFSETFK